MRYYLLFKALNILPSVLCNILWKAYQFIYFKLVDFIFIFRYIVLLFIVISYIYYCIIYHESIIKDNALILVWNFNIGINIICFKFISFLYYASKAYNILLYYIMYLLYYNWKNILIFTYYKLFYFSNRIYARSSFNTNNYA